MKKFFSLFLMLAFVSVLTLGCQPASEEGDTTTSTESSDDGSGTADEGDTSSVDEEPTITVAAYCGSCGHAAGSEDCCADGAEKCDCGMAKGSALCCKVDGDLAGKKLCGTCGHIAGTDDCCSDDGTVCSDCGLHTGSVLCCKL